MRDGLSAIRGLHRGVLAAAVFAAWGCASAPVVGQQLPPADVAPVDRTLPECPDAEACFAAARAAMERGDVSAGRERLLLIRDRWLEAPWPGRAALVLARLEMDGDPASALDWALKASMELPLVGDRALALASDAERRSGRPEQAAGLLETLTLRYPESSLAPTALWSAAELWSSIDGRQDDALKDLLELVARFPQDPRAPAALARVVSLGESAGRLDQTASACRALLVEYAASTEAGSASGRCERLVQAGAVPALTFADRRRRAEMLARGAKFADALTEWKDLRRAAPSPAVAREAELQAAIAMYRLRQWDDAWRAFRRLAASGTGAELREEARLWEGRAAFRRDDIRGLRRAESAMAAEFPESPRRLELVSLHAAWYRGQGRVDRAVATYQEFARVATDLRRSDKVVEAYWNIGWLEYRRGRLAAAREALTRGLDAAAPSDPQIPQLLYWTARLAALDPEQPAGDEDERARVLGDRFPYTYYGLLARRGGTAVGEASSPDVLDDVKVFDEAGVAPDVPPDHAQFPRAAELWFLGMRADARDEMLIATRRAPPAPDRAADIAEALATLGADEEALRLVRRHFAPALERGDAALSPAIWRRAYPAHLLDPIRSRARDRVDPFLVAGLIREESVYDPRAVSPVGAIGLMQIMPDTGRRVARAAGLSDFSVDQLYTPEVNLTLGVRYLGDLLDRFAGNQAYAVAAYNAGPEAVTRWLESGRPRAIDEFVEEIPFVETRGYVKRVLRSAWLYHALYAPAESRMVRAPYSDSSRGTD